jgi:hypothetical protein
MYRFGEFAGVIGRDWSDSTPWWPPVVKPADDAPNVLLIVLDNVGFAQLGCYGSDISTPVIDGLANEGLRLANFHTTARCSPTRSCLLTGRNHHNNGMGRITQSGPADRQSNSPRLSQSQARSPPTPESLHVLPERLTGARNCRRRYAQSITFDFGHGDHSARAGARRNVAGPGFGARWLVVPHPRRVPTLRPQPLRQGDTSSVQRRSLVREITSWCSPTSERVSTLGRAASCVTTSSSDRA